MTWKCVGTSFNRATTASLAEAGSTVMSAPSSCRVTPKNAARPSVLTPAWINASNGSVGAESIRVPSNALRYVSAVVEATTTSSAADCVSLQPGSTRADHRTAPVSISTPNTRPASALSTTAILSKP